MVSQNQDGDARALPPTFQDVIMNLQRYWSGVGCVILQPYDNEVGAGTNVPLTAGMARTPTVPSTTSSSRC